MKLNNSRGQSLIEVLAGLAMAVLIVAALINMVTASLRSAQFAKSTSTATKYGQEIIEWLRSQRDSLGWSSFVAQSLNTNDTATWCFRETSWPAVSQACGLTSYICSGHCANNINTIFKREVLFTKNGDSKINVKVKVSWTDQSLSEHKSDLETILSDTGKWR